MYKKFEKLLKERGVTPYRVHKETGISTATLSDWKNGKSQPKKDKIEKICQYFDIPISYFYTENDRTRSLSNIFPIELKKFPMLGEIACGVPKYTNENRESYVMSGTNIKADFCLTARGDSMINARILDGDIVFIKKQDIVENGEIAAVVVNHDNEATLKRFYYYKERSTLILKAENSKYDDLIFQDEELNQIHVLGKAIAFQSDVI